MSKRTSGVVCAVVVAFGSMGISAILSGARRRTPPHGP